MKALLVGLLAVLALASAVGVVAARRAAGAALALGLNLLVVAAIALTLGSPLVAGTMAILGVGILLGSPRDWREDGEPAQAARASRPHGMLLPIALLLLVALGGALLGGYPAGAQFLKGGILFSAVRLGQVADLLFARYGLGLVGLALLTVAALAGARLRGAR